MPHHELLLGQGCRRWVTLGSLLIILVGACSSISVSNAFALSHEISATQSLTKPYYACPNTACLAVIDPPVTKVADGEELPGGPLLEGSGELGGFSPSDLRSAYDIPTTGGEGQTVAVVDAYGDPTAESDLAKYREEYGLGACTKSSGCFKKYNEQGEEQNYPSENGVLEVEWRYETSLDLDMVSTACPKCHIVLVEASSQYAENTSASVNEAVKLGATEVSNSYGYPEKYKPWCGTTGCAQYASSYSHVGVPITASSGDTGFEDHAEGVSFPAAAPGSIAVGGTALYRSAGESNPRGWAEEVWYGSGSGCSGFETKPEWQKSLSECTHRIDNDTAAVASCETPVSVYNKGGWLNICGTSVSAPLVAGMLAHAPASVRDATGADAFYEPEYSSSLYDITVGSNGYCSGTEYLCKAGVGYDGPTGNGALDRPLLPECAEIAAEGEGPNSVFIKEFTKEGGGWEQSCSNKPSINWTETASGPALASWGTYTGELEL